MTTILAITAALIIIAALVAIVVLVIGQRNDAWAESERLERELEARAPGVTMVPRVTFTAPVVKNRAVQGVPPDLHIVPPQRSDSWLERVMDEQAALGNQQDGA